MYNQNMSSDILSFHMGEIQFNQLSTKWLAGLLEAGIISEAQHWYLLLAS